MKRIVQVYTETTPDELSLLNSLQGRVITAYGEHRSMTEQDKPFAALQLENGQVITFSHDQDNGLTWAVGSAEGWLWFAFSEPVVIVSAAHDACENLLGVTFTVTTIQGKPLGDLEINVIYDNETEVYLPLNLMDLTQDEAEAVNNG